MAGSSEAEIARYRERGCLVPGYRLPTERVDALRAALDELAAGRNDLEAGHSR